MAKKTFSVLILLLVVQFGFSQTIDKAKLDSYFQALERNNKFIGSVALSQNGKILYTKQVGFSDVETKTKPDENTKYRIGSISKTFTTVLIFKAVEEKKIKLSDKIDSYFPGLKNADKISIEQLLYHRTGIHNVTSNSDYLQWNTKPKTEKELVDIIIKSGSDFEPDSKAEYSNSNFILLTFILQKLYKKDYSKIVDEKIISPIGLKNTFVGQKINLANNESNSYRYISNWIKEPETDMSIPLGAGAIVSTPTDLTKFADALFNGKLISQQNVLQMETTKDKYGMGLFQIPFYDKIGFGHTGGIDGFSSVFSYYANDKLSVAITSNGINNENNNITIVLLSSFYNKPYEIPTFKTFEVTTEHLDRYLGVYTSNDIPLKITISKNGKTLMAQATGQSAFGLEATEKDKFKFDQEDIKVDFNPTDKTMVLKQRGRTYNFTRER